MVDDSTSPPDWANLSVLHRNTLPPRASFYTYTSEAAALSRDVARAEATSLSGIWEFQLCDSPLRAQEVSRTTGTDPSGWSHIEVPGHWQLQGFGRGPHYTNVQFPFHVDPPWPPYTDNECGTYVREFEAPESWKDSQLRLRFEGVDSGFHVWVNGQSVGYSQGARNPSEFDITGYVELEATNRLAVRVYQFTDGSYIEDQDQWWLSGIFREVCIHRFPEQRRFEDFSFRTVFDEEFQDATLHVDAEVLGKGEVKVKLLDALGAIVACERKYKSSKEAGTVAFSIPVRTPRKWTAETPYLYSIVLALDNTFFTAHRIGFRQVEIQNGMIVINGRRVVFKGANRHEHHPRFGRAVPYEFMKQDLLLMKRHNLNSIRTCHQPSDPRLYDLADELGFWVMDEADLECHGFETIADAALPPTQRDLPFAERQTLTREHAAKWTSDNPAWKDAYVDRAKQLVHRDRLHTCVVIWSLGNEAFYGRNHTAMRDWIKACDASRPIHYEPDVEAEHVDMYSRMYPDVDDVVAFGKDSSKSKPLVLCEYIHAMGTGPGNIKEYVDTFYEYPKVQGGWVWEWANHGLLTKTKHGRPFYAYGGDFGDVPNDYNFIMDGVLNSAHQPRSALLEYKKALEPVQLVTWTGATVRIINRLDFQTLDHLRCELSVVNEWDTASAAGLGSETEIQIPEGTQPGATVELTLPLLDVDSAREIVFNLSFKLRESTPWAAAGHELALLQRPLTSPRKLHEIAAMANATLRIQANATMLVVTGLHSQWEFDLVEGALSFWKKDEKQVVSRPLLPSFYRAVTDNDAPRDGKEWRDRLLHLAEIQTRSSDWRQHEDGSVRVSFSQKLAPSVLSWSVNLQTEYIISPFGEVRIHVEGDPVGLNLPATLPRIGVTLGLPRDFQHVRWFGRGPEESYKDMKLSQRVALHDVFSVDELWTDPDFPQECSNRTDTRWLQISSEETSLKVQFANSVNGCERKLFDFMASHYRTEDIDEAQHPFDLERLQQTEVILRLDADHHGLGTGSCGPKTLEKYALKAVPFSFTVVLQ